ncbi:MAG: glutamate synthase domain-containing protein 2 [Planctomycetota bacterium]|jgi:glutamate synthase domain-containing protein 2
MIRRWFYGLSLASMLGLALIALVWPGALWALLVLVPILALGFRDALQTKSTILRNFPLIGHFRYLLEAIRPELQQYFIELNTDAFPIEREMRSLVYQRAKGELETQPFGTQRNVYAEGYEWVAHALADVEHLESEPRLLVGGEACSKPYSASLLNISAMSFGSLSPTAIEALSRGAREGGFAHNTGEGGVSPYHLNGGGDLVWQIGTGYFGCRSESGTFDPERFAETACHDSVKMIEIKLSQGAKPGHGGVLPAAKVTAEIARIRHVPIGETVVSPPRHSAFRTPLEMMEFIAQLRELSGGKPVGVKLCIGRQSELLAMCKAMLETGITPDFLTVDGGEGGTGAAPLEFSNRVGMPGHDAWAFAHSALVGTGLRDRVKIFASGKILTGFDMIRAMALGADACNSARGMMLSIGCIQALRCNNDTCPTGVATQNVALYRGLHVPSKATRVASFHDATIKSFLTLLHAIAAANPSQVTPDMIHRQVGQAGSKSLAEIYDFLEPMALLGDRELPHAWRKPWSSARSNTFVAAPLETVS